MKFYKEKSKGLWLFMIRSLDFFIRKSVFFFLETSSYVGTLPTPKLINIDLSSFVPIFSTLYTFLSKLSTFLEGVFFVVCRILLYLTGFNSSSFSSSILNLENLDLEWCDNVSAVFVNNWFILESICLWLSFLEGKQFAYFIISSRRISNLELLLSLGLIIG